MGQRSLQELIGVDSPAWPGLKDALGRARNQVEVLPRDPVRSAATLEGLQITLGSNLGAVAYETGGLLVDHGWVRVLGGGSDRGQGLAEWNGLCGTPPLEDTAGLCIVAYDLIGGFFALDGQANGEAVYFAPDTLGWERLARGYSGLIRFLLDGDLNGYYPFRWSGWEREASDVPFDRALSLLPPPFMKEGKDLSRVSRRPVPAQQVWSVGQGYAKQFGGPTESG